MLNRRLYVFACIILCTIMLSGCWDSRELDQRAIIIALGVDTGRSNPNNYSITVEVPIPIQFDIEHSSASSRDSSRTIRAEGKTLSRALTNLNLRVARNLFLGHLQVAIVSEEVARNSITPIIDQMSRYRHTQLATIIAIASSRAQDIFTVRIPTDQTIGTYMTTFFEKGNRARHVPTAPLWKVQSQMAQPHQGFVLPLIVPGSGQIGIVGLAVIHRGRMIGRLDTRLLQGYLWLTSDLLEEVLVLNDARKGSELAVRAEKGKAKIVPTLQDGELSITIHISSDLTIVQDSHEDRMTQAALDAIEEESVDIIRGIVIDTIRKAQRLQVDIFGWGNIVRGKFPGYWNSVNWELVFPEIDVHVFVDTKARRTGMEF